MPAPKALARKIPNPVAEPPSIRQRELANAIQLSHDATLKEQPPSPGSVLPFGATNNLARDRRVPTGRLPAIKASLIGCVL
jgi:hypothetical protein